jgi:hypothetical protein
MLSFRYGVIAPGAPPGMHQFGLYPSPGGPSPAAALTQLERERLERLGEFIQYNLVLTWFMTPNH